MKSFENMWRMAGELIHGTGIGMFMGEFRRGRGGECFRHAIVYVQGCMLMLKWLSLHTVNMVLKNLIRIKNFLDKVIVRLCVKCKCNFNIVSIKHPFGYKYFSKKFYNEIIPILYIMAINTALFLNVRDIYYKIVL